MTGEKIEVVGICYVTMEVHGHRVEEVPLYVVQGNGPALFDEEGIHMTEDAIAAVTEAPRPESRSEMQSFLGLITKPLSYILGPPRKGIPVLAAARIQRWAIQLAAYDYDIELRRSRDNGNADALSRLPLPDCDSNASDKLVNGTQEATAFNMHQVKLFSSCNCEICCKRETLHDAVLARALYYTRNGWPDSEDIAQELKPFHSRQHEFSIEEGCLLWGARVVIPSRFRIQILEELHGGHPGIVRMKGLARLHVWWPNIDQDIENTVQGCSACQATQPMPTRAEGNPWKWLLVRGKEYMLISQDHSWDKCTSL
ncbi:uncharacterized protein K02A2.6-like [Macrobrachium nipponense]|uniref:uncharacterized protein K02A2.6-like n=1 Tax=Macrobrachium nipponense TaxID=159736 RepID=UPI0030C8A5B3